MKRHIFLSTVAAASLLLQASAYADPPQDRGQGQAEKKDQPHPQGQGAAKHAPSAAAQTGAGGGARGPAERGATSQAVSRQPGGNRGRQPQAQAAAPAPQHTQQAPVARTDRTPNQPRIDRGAAAPAAQHAVPTAPDIRRQPGVRTGQQPSSGQQQFQRPPTPRQVTVPSLGQWRAPASRPERNQAGQQWRQQHQSWDQNARWRQSPDWWRSDSSFRLFNGLRIGFFFVPDRGYIALPMGGRRLPAILVPDL